MNLNASQSTACAVDIDALLQDTYLLVVELREGASPGNGRDLRQH